MTSINSLYRKRQKNLAVTWGLAFLLIFPLLILLGFLMRMGQGELAAGQTPLDFYSMMTFHGLGMIGILYSLAFAGVWYLLSTRYIRLNITLGYILLATILIGLGGLAIGTLIGKFAAGWYLLYPLPFKNPSWKSSATGISVISLIILGVSWLIGILHVLYALAKKYNGFGNLLGWQYLRKGKPKKEIRPLVMISTISLVPGVFACIAGAVLLILYLLQHFEPSLSFDPLAMKNLVMFFGHTIANITMYLAVGWVYALLPEFTGRKIKMNKLLVISWNATFFFIVFAFFHHMYMDFVQPLPFQYIGQIASYLSALPATAVTMFTVISQFYRSKIKGSIIPVMFLLGTAGWAIGGFAAVTDATISINEVMHNTLWVPAHFHTYMLLGVVPFVLGFLFYLFSPPADRHGNRLAKAGLWTFILGGYGFVTMFYLGGFHSVPRRFSGYSIITAGKVHDIGVLLARIAVISAGIVFLGLLLIYLALFMQLLKKRKTTVPVSEGTDIETDPELSLPDTIEQPV